MFRRPKSFLWQSLMLSALYAALGIFALGFAISPGITAPFFPAAGLALAAVLLGGWRLLPAIWLGSVLVQLVASAKAGIALQPQLIFVVPLGACGQAAFGAWLAHRLKIWPSTLDEPRPVALLIGVVATIGCLPSATLANLMQQVVSNTSSAADLFNWANWWAGDALGVLLFTPVCLALWASPAKHWEGRRAAISIPLLLAGLACSAALMLVRQREENRLHDEFLSNAEYVDNLLRNSLKSRLDILQALERHAALAPQLSREDWTHLTTPWLKRYPGIINLTWNPHLTPERLAGFEAAQRATGRPDFALRDRDAQGRLQPLGAHAEYFPITYAEPLQGNERAIGINSLSNPASKIAIDRSRLTGLPAASTPFPLVQSVDGEPGIVIYQAVFPPHETTHTKAGVLGVVSSAMRIGDLLSHAHEEVRQVHIELCLADLSRPPERQELAGPKGCANPDWSQLRPTVVQDIAFADRNWQILLRAGTEYTGASRSWAAGAALGVALLFCGLISAFLLLNSGRTRRTAALVAQRTAELANATHRLRDQQSLLTQAQRIAHMGSWELSADHSKLHCSEELLNLLGLPPDMPVHDHDLMACLIEEDRQRLAVVFEDVRDAPGRQTLDCRMANNEDVEQILHFHVESEWRRGRLLRLFGTVQNVTSAREAEAHIQYLARFDALTQLPNRSYWLEQARIGLQSAQRHGDEAAVLFLDLDHFKTINDSLGHQIGDQLLTAVARRLRDCLRAEDLLARQGGDEFVLLLPRLSGMTGITHIAGKLVRCLAEPFVIENHELSISVSVGIAHYPGDAQDVDTLLKHADLAMYSAKQIGRNNYQFFVPEMNARAMQRLQLESALRRGIDRDELVLHFQPQQDIASGRIVACEALVRWQHPELGMVPPAQFIPLAEDSGLILPLGEWVLREACLQQVRWAKSGIRLTMAINIAALQFQQTDFVERVCRILAETGAAPQDIELEITESALLASTDALIERLNLLCDKGITLALDDFGTGYSCLAYLKRLPIERLKIDRSFVKDLPGDAEDAAIASATLSMARDLGMQVTAEGVENAAQHAWLETRGCAMVQGYFISRPLPAEAFTAWLQQTSGGES